jgi:hypothetical protein
LRLSPFEDDEFDVVLEALVVLAATSRSGGTGGGAARRC